MEGQFPRSSNDRRSRPLCAKLSCSSESETEGFFPSPPPEGHTMSPNGNDQQRKKRGMNILKRLKCVAPGCGSKQSDEPVQQHPINESTDNSLVLNTAPSSLSDLSSSVEYITNESEGWYLSHKDLMEVFSATWESDGVDNPLPLRSMESIQEEHSLASASQVSSTNPTTTIIQQKSISNSNSVRTDDMYVSPCSDDFQHQTDQKYTLNETEQDLERILDCITVIQDEANFNEPFQTSPVTPLRSNAQWAQQKSTARVQHRIVSPSPINSPPHHRTRETSPQRSKEFAQLLRKFEKLSQFLQADESMSVTSTIATELEHDEVHETIPVALIYRDQTWSMTDTLLELPPAESWEDDPNQLQIPVSDDSTSTCKEDETPKTTLERKGDFHKLQHADTWDDEQTNPQSLDGSSSFGNASFSSLNVPIVARTKVKWNPKPRKNLTSHPFFWRSHPRVTSKSYDCNPVMLLAANSRNYDVSGVIVNPPAPSTCQSATPGSSVAALEPRDDDLDAEMDDEDDFLVMYRTPQKLRPERVHRFDTTYTHFDGDGYPEYRQELQYTENQLAYSPWGSVLEQETGEI